MGDELNELGIYEGKKSANETIQSSLLTRKSPLSEPAEKFPMPSSSTKVLKNGSSNRKWKRVSSHSIQPLVDKKNLHSTDSTSQNATRQKNQGSQKVSETVMGSKQKSSKVAQKKKSSVFEQSLKQEFLKNQLKKKSKNVALSGATGSNGELGESNEQTSWTDSSKTAYDTSETLVKKTHKGFNFLKKKQNFGSGVLENARQSMFFGNRAKESVRDIGKIAETTKYTGGTFQRLGFSWKNLSQRASETFSKVLSPKALAVKFSTVAGGAGLLAIFVFLLVFFIVNLIGNNNNSANSNTNDGVFYVKNWDGNDAYHSSFLAQRYGITVAQIDGFIASEGYKNLDSRASGEEFLRLQQISGIDVRVLVAFAQIESQFGTAGVAADYPKSNLFGYGAVDSDPNQGAAWDNTRAVNDFRSTQIDSFGNKSLAICDARAQAYHDGTLAPGQAVYWTALNSGKDRAKIEEAFNTYINQHGGTPDPPGGYGPPGQSGGAGLTSLDAMLGQVIQGTYGGETGQCYAVPAYYAHSINPSITLKNGVAAADIGIDYDWKAWGWAVVNNPMFQDVRPGDIITFKRGANMGNWNASSDYGHVAVVGQIVSNGVLKIYDQNPTPLKTWDYTFNPSGVAAVIHPPAK